MVYLHFSNFSKGEDGMYQMIRAKKDRFLFPFCVLLKKYHVLPDHLSYLGLGMSLFFVFFLQYSFWISSFFLILNIFFDGIDGTYARFLDKSDVKGELLDRACDYVSFLIMFLGLVYYHVLNPFWGAMYLVSFSIMFFLTVSLNSLKIDFPFVFKSKYFIYFLFLLLTISGINFFDPTIVFFSVYMLITDLFLFYKLRCSL